MSGHENRIRSVKIIHPFLIGCQVVVQPEYQKSIRSSVETPLIISPLDATLDGPFTFKRDAGNLF
jgi:hypothetical protein